MADVMIDSADVIPFGYEMDEDHLMLRDSIRDEQPTGPVRLAQAGHEPALSLARLLGSYGMIKPALLERYTSQGRRSFVPAAR